MAIPKPAGQERQRLRIRVRGAVQGVGFRPHVHGLARRFDLAGFVLNDGEGVLAEVEGLETHAFLEALTAAAPPLARIRSVEVAGIALRGEHGFSIAGSRAGRAATRLPADAATCPQCLAELFDPASRFYDYPFVTCTHCGPRFTIARALPYDRATTAMSALALCKACAHDYENPESRRFHAETIACPDCGPRLSHSIAEIAAAIRGGGIVALQGTGGFQLLCDARNSAAVARLRAAKHRGAKPFAVMVADSAAVHAIARPSAAELALVCQPAAPIVLMRGKSPVQEAAAPGLSQTGVMLASAPVHHLILAGLGHGEEPPALIATSGNRGGEPIAITPDEAEAALSGIAGLVAGHDRAIVARADDSVMAVIAGAPAFLRRARGFVPEPVELAEDGPDCIAYGAHLKATVTLTRGREAFVSQHIGDLDRRETIRFHRETAERLKDLLGIVPRIAACDLHPDYRSMRLAEESGLPLIRVQHHAAHVAALAAEHGVNGALLGVALDGYGLGDDGGAWGGELLLLNGAAHRRLGHLAPLPLPGGDLAARQPWRMALAACAAVNLPETAERLARRPGGEAVLALLRRGGVPVTTSMGRFFDAAVGLLGLCETQDYEGQAAMRLEALATSPAALADGFSIAGGILDFSPLLRRLPETDAATGANLLHGTLAEGLAAWIEQAASALGVSQVALGGGCLMNRVLAEELSARLAAAGVKALLARAVPPNDGGLSLGQALIARRAATIAREK